MQGTPLHQPNGIVFDPQGNIVVANYGNAEVLTFSSTGEVITTEKAAQAGSDIMRRFFPRIASLWPLRYHITYASFLRGCATREDIDEQIRRFRTYLAEAVPPHLDHFFAEVLQKVDPLKLERHKLVFKLDGSPELISLMARDEILRQHILKADGFHLIIDEQDATCIRRRLETYG